MNLEDVEAFVQVVESHGFTAAGRVLARTTKQVSRQVHRLEEELGVSLLTRSTRAVAPTDAGRRFYVHAKRIIEAAVSAVRDVHPDNRALYGHLRVALPTLSATTGLPQALRSFREQYPGVSIELRLTDQALDVVADGLDLQLTTARPSQGTLVMRRLFTMSAPLVAHQRYIERFGMPDHPQGLADHECLRFTAELPQETWSLVHDSGATVSVPVSGRLQSSSSEVLFGALHEGLGIGVCGPGYLAGEGARRGLVRVLEGWAFEPLPMYAVFPPANRDSRLVEAFLEVMLDMLRAVM